MYKTFEEREKETARAELEEIKARLEKLRDNNTAIMKEGTGFRIDKALDQLSQIYLF